jgi:hypothetical protein
MLSLGYAPLYTALCTKEGIPNSTLLSFSLRLFSCERADGACGWAGGICTIELYSVGAAAAYDCLQDLAELNTSICWFGLFAQD